jgi:transcriptional regulator with XRE-family HTH domain
MTLQELLEQHGIHQPIELARLLDIDRRHAWEILHGKIRLAPRFALALHDQLGIPLDQLLRAGVKPKPARRGRPPKTSPPKPPSKGRRKRKPQKPEE